MADFQVIAFGLAEAAVAVAIVELVDDAQFRVTGETVATFGDAQLVAVAKDVVGVVCDDGVVDADLPPVQRDVQPFGERRAPDQAQCAAGRGLRLQVGVGAVGEGPRRLPAAAGDRLVALAELAVAVSVGDVGGAACTHLRAAGRSTVDGVAGIAEAGGEGFRTTAIQIGDGRCAEALGPRAADQQLVDRLPGEAELAVEGAAEGGVVRVSGSGAQAQLTRTGQVAQHRHAQLQVGLVDTIATTGGACGQVGGGTGLCQRIGDEAAIFAAALRTHCEAQLTCRQGGETAAEVGEQVAGSGTAAGEFLREQPVLQFRVAGQAIGIILAIGHQRVPGPAPADRRLRCTALDLAGCRIVEGRPGGIGDALLVQVAGGALDQFAAVVLVAGFPVEIATAEFEAALERCHALPGGQFAGTDARNLPRAAVPVHVTRRFVAVMAAERIEPAVDRHRRDAGCAGLERVAGHLTLRGALVVGQLGVEADLVVQIHAGVNEDRVALDRCLQVHLLVAVADITAERRVVADMEAVRTSRLAATVERIAAATAVAAARALEAGDAAPLADRGPTIVRMTIGIGVGTEAPVLRPHALFFDMLGGEADRGAFIRPACNHVVLGAGAVAFAELAMVDAGGHALDVAAGDDVDHAGHRVGTVDGRCAVLQYFHALHGSGRNAGDVLVTTGCHAQAFAIDQHQRALRTQAAHVHVTATGGFASAERAGAAQCRAAGCGQVLQDVGDGIEALPLDVSAADGQHGLSGFQIDLADARASDLDAVQGGGFNGMLGECGNSQRSGGCHRKRSTDRQPKFGNTDGHRSLSLPIHRCAAKQGCANSTAGGGRSNLVKARREE
ncbi:hypothetical protein D3C75_530110 [compost metagenome]